MAGTYIIQGQSPRSHLEGRKGPRARLCTVGGCLTSSLPPRWCGVGCWVCGIGRRAQPTQPPPRVRQEEGGLGGPSGRGLEAVRGGRRREGDTIPPQGGGKEEKDHKLWALDHRQVTTFEQEPCRPTRCSKQEQKKSAMNGRRCRTLHLATDRASPLHRPRHMCSMTLEIRPLWSRQLDWSDSVLAPRGYVTRLA